ncbi:MAG: peptidylprolyl isomerase [Bacteroidia bacterium]|nr:peptidylprolyl isomerase [Bacteroidia bacterium]
MKKLVLSLLTLFSASGILAQDTITLDRIVAVVGNNIILESEIASQIAEYKRQGEPIPPNAKCILLEQLLVQRLLLAQAIRDSVEVSDQEVESELDRRLKYFIGKVGGDVAAFENFYGKPVEVFKEDYRDDVKNMLLIQRMTSKITGDLDVSPLEVQQYFESLHPDSVPFINAQVEIGQIMKKPVVNKEMKEYARMKAEEIYKDAKAGKDFTVLVKAYSCDPGSNGKQGAPTYYTNIGRNTFVPEFEQWAFSLKPGEISPVFESPFGYHVLKLLARKGEFVDVAHVLVCIETSDEDLKKARTFLDSLGSMIAKDSISFVEAASRFSDDEETKISGGSVYNPFTGEYKFEMEQLSQFDPALFLVVDKLGSGEVSASLPTSDRTDGKQAFRIIYIKSRTQPHRANMKEDYQRLKDDAQAAKEEKLLRDWVNKRTGGVHVWIADDFKSCSFGSVWIKP